MDNILKVVVADDESIQSEGLAQIIRDMLPRVQVYVCGDGEEAYQVICSEDIDVLFTDIRMPVMDGIELIGKLSRENRSVKTVLISAYQDFEYARSAIKHGAIEYLVKPIRREKIRKLLEKIDAELSADMQKIREKSEYEKLVAQYHHDNKMKQLASVLNHLVSIDKLESNIAESLNTNGVIVLLRWKNQSPARKEGPYLTEIQQEILIKKISGIFNGCYLVPMEKGLDIKECRVAVLASGYNAAECCDQLLQLQNEWKRSGIIFWCGISDQQSDLLSGMRAAMQQAEEVISYCFYKNKEGGVFLYQKIDSYFSSEKMSVSVYEKELREAVHKGDCDRIRILADDMKGKQGTPPYHFPFKLKHMISSMVMGIVSDLEGMIAQSEYDKLLDESYKSFGECDSMEELFLISSRLLMQTAAYFIRMPETYDVTEDVIAYIKSHFAEEMTLQQLADRVHFSANYLSRKIKKHTGMTYTGYITFLRIEQARKMLLQSNQKVVDIAAQCGFHDSSYFNRIFRRNYNTSPEQYRKVHKNVKED